jgi:hypothetical protein
MFEVLKRGRRHNLSIECQLELFNKMVKPILLYGSEIWGFSKNIQCLLIHEKSRFSSIKRLYKIVDDKYESFVSLPVNSLAQYDIILNFTSISIGNNPSSPYII